jgi:DNA-binding XRE family transcriptional regulator
VIPVPGVYMLRHKSGRVYVGSSRDVATRCKQHMALLQFGRHPVAAMQKDWDIDGAAAFEATLLEPIAPDGSKLDVAEQLWGKRLADVGAILYAKTGGRTDTRQSLTVPGLKKVRHLAALSQRELAQRSGVAASTIANAETGAEVYPSTVRRLAKALGCEARELMESES